ncbi:MAG TPA: DUF4397 domain-containing protein [Actinocrinis sp.]|nr:DUF4397 domain-containing protein [Actinocrinis sp.]
MTASAAIASVALLPLSAATAQASASQVGWVRLAHLSPNTPAVDVYLYPFGNASAQIVLKHVAYGTASGYESLKPGLYLVAMRSAGAAAASNPVISTEVQVAAGAAYTVAGLGPFSALTLDVLDDQLSVPAGHAGVRVIEASLAAPDVTVTAGSDNIATNLHFPSVTGYQTVEPGSWTVKVATQTAAATSKVTLASDSTHTFAVLDGTNGVPKLLDLGDAAGASTLPVGGVQTGFGGTADKSGGQLETDLIWGALLALGAGSGLFAAFRLRRG